MPLQKLRQPKITRFESCDSTNRLLLDAAEAGVPAGSVYVARQQLAGRGRRGRRWIAAPDHSLIFSLLWTFPADPVKLQGLSLLVGLAVIRALSDPRLGHAAPETRCGLKWPNDLMLQRHDGSYAKAGGILIESVLRQADGGGRELAVVIGMGLNCISDAMLSANVTDQPVGALSELFSVPVTPEAFLPCLLDVLVPMLGDFECHGFGPFSSEWNTHDIWHDQRVQISEEGAVRSTGLCRGVDREGALLVATDVAIERMITGDVSLRRL